MQIKRKKTITTIIFQLKRKNIHQHYSIQSVENKSKSHQFKLPMKEKCDMIRIKSRQIMMLNNEFFVIPSGVAFWINFKKLCAQIQRFLCIYATRFIQIKQKENEREERINNIHAIAVISKKLRLKCTKLFGFG
ncbi:unnamed protein product [Vicia faba]|uniref:Transmembrane protein n=1 Tax=Vicia faba TaxID=3906 RepID=A0AAV0YFD9_VICFA|nr:unnamed protein product [Vicia faba]